jgi:putative intracellular protease/amidase
VDRQLSNANPDDYDALLLPGGQMNPDSLRIDQAAIQFIRSIAEEGRPIAAICHGPALLIEAVRGRCIHRKRRPRIKGMPRGASPKREREYKKIEHKFEKEGRYKGREKEVAARIVNKQRAKAGETKKASSR